jgi:TolA-binding protein
VTKQTESEAAARARFLIGEIHFADKNHAEAVRHFFKAAFGYSHPKWQAAAHYESGRCFEVLKKTAQAIESYREVVEKFPESDKASLAKERLEALQKAS